MSKIWLIFSQVFPLQIRRQTCLAGPETPSANERTEVRRRMWGTIIIPLSSVRTSRNQPPSISQNHFHLCMQETKLSEIQSSQVSFMSIKALYIWFGVILTFLVAYFATKKVHFLCFPWVVPSFCTTSLAFHSRLRNVTTDCFVPHAWFIHLNSKNKKWGMWFIQQTICDFEER